MLKNNFFDKSTIIKIKINDEREIESVFNKLIFYTGLIVNRVEDFVDETIVGYNVETTNLDSIFCDDYLVKINI